MFIRKWLLCSLLVSLGAFSWPSEVMAGLASWYGEAFHGKMTASGEIYDMTDFTAAHRTLPFGTQVKIINLLNNRVIIVRINDRGPFKEERIIDVSKAAAQELDFIRNGIIPVRLEILIQAEEEEGSVRSQVATISSDTPSQSLSSASQGGISSPLVVTEEDGKSSHAFAGLQDSSFPQSSVRDIVYIQVGSYRDLENATKTARVLLDSGFSPEIREKDNYYRVFFEQDPEFIKDSLHLLRNQGYHDPLVRRTRVDGQEIDWQRE